jgi:hypothetical protein
MLNGFLRIKQPEHFVCGQKMNSAQIPIRVWRSETVQMRTTDGRENQWIRMIGYGSAYLNWN